MEKADLRVRVGDALVDPTRARTAVWAIVGWIVIGLGIAIRAVQFAYDRSLWLDEALLTLNLIDRSYLDLFGELEFMQAAPPAFLVAAKASGELTGYSELGLRLVPFLAGILSLLIFARLSRELVSGLGRVVALLIVALAPWLVYYSSEVKQYAVDVLVTLVVLLLAIVLRRRPLDGPQLALLSIAGAAAVAISYASVFALAGALCALAVDAVERAEWRRLRRLVIPALFWGLGLGMIYLVTRSNVDSIRQALAGTTFYPDGVDWYPRAIVHVGYYLFGHPGTLGKAIVVLAGALAAVGIVTLARRNRFEAVLLVTPLVAPLVASTLELYPYGGRFVLFALPLLALLIGCGVEALTSRAASRPPLAAAALAATAIGGLLAFQSGPELVSPRKGQEIRPVLEYVRARWQPGDVLFVHGGAQYAARYYAEIHDVNVRSGEVLWPAIPPSGDSSDDLAALLSSPPELVVGRQDPDDGRDELEEGIRMLAGQPRVWFVLSHVTRWEDGAFVDDTPAHVELLDRAGERMDEFHRTGAAAYLIDVRDDADEE